MVDLIPKVIRNIGARIGETLSGSSVKTPIIEPKPSSLPAAPTGYTYSGTTSGETVLIKSTPTFISGGGGGGSIPSTNLPISTASTFISGGGGGTGLSLPTGQDLALQRLQQNQQLTQANLTALRNLNLQNYAQAQGINYRNLDTDVKQRNFLNRYNRFVEEQKKKAETPEQPTALETVKQQSLPVGLREGKISTKGMEIKRLGTEERGTAITQQSFNAGKIYFKPTLYREQIGTITDEITGKQIPYLSDVKYINPKKIGLAEYRKAISDETKQFEQFEKESRILEAGKAPPKIIREFGEIKGIAEQKIYQENKDANKYLQEIGFDDKNIEKFSDFSANIVPIAYIIPSGREFIKGGVKSIVTDITQKPFTNIGLFGLGYAGGLIIEGLPLAFKGGVKLLGLEKTASVLAKGTKITGLVAGGILTANYAKSVGSELLQEDISAEKRGEIFGKAIKDTALIGYGFAAGAKEAKQVQGLINTRGRTEINIPQGDFPSAPANKQLKLFQENIYPQLSERAGAFHTTANRFIDKEIFAGKGSSELSGLYGSTLISRPFAKVSGSSNSLTTDLSIEKLLKEILSINEPATAFLVPERFRYSPAQKIPNIPAKPLGYRFIRKAEIGTADVPLIKSEIEAVFRPEAFKEKTGGLKLKQQKYYVNIKRVRVPLDVFEFEKLNNRELSQSGKIFKSSDYPDVNIKEYYPKNLNIKQYHYSSVSNAKSTYSNNFYSPSSKYSGLSSSALSFSSLRSGSSISKASSSIDNSISSNISKISSQVSSSLKSSSSFNKIPITSPPSYPPNTPYKTIIFNIGRLPKPIGRRYGSSKSRQAYSVLLRKRIAGKYGFIPIAAGLPRGQALRFGAERTIRDLSRRFRIIQQGITETEDIAFKPSEKIFRQFRVRQGKRIPLDIDTYIQRTNANLQTFSEKELLRQARIQAR